MPFFYQKKLRHHICFVFNLHPNVLIIQNLTFLSTGLSEIAGHKKTTMVAYANSNIILTKKVAVLPAND